MVVVLWPHRVERLDDGAVFRACPRARGETIGKTRARPDQARFYGAGIRIENAGGILVVEALAIDEEQRAPLLRRELPEKIGGERVELLFPALVKQKLESLLTRLCLTERLGMIAETAEPQRIDLGEGPAIERGSPLIAMMLVEHAKQRAAKERLALLLLAGEHIGKALG